jgi:hypothetical protein
LSLQQRRQSRSPLLLNLLSSLAIVLAVPVFAAIYVYFVPTYSARVRVDQVGGTIELAFFYTSGRSSDGRYLTVGDPETSVTRPICGYDWAHHARTSVYLTPDRRIAVLGSEDGCEALVSIRPLAITHAVTGPSQDWTYLGAFDFTPVTYGRVFRFFPATEQPECVPWSGHAERPIHGRHREAAWGQCR